MKSNNTNQISINFLTFYIILMWITIAHLLISLNYFEKSHINNFFWLNHDFPGIEKVKIVQGFGIHYFGDFLHSLTVTANPAGTVSYWPYLPLSNLILKPLVNLNYLTAYVLFLVFFLPFIFSTLWYLFKSVKFSYFILFSLVYYLTNVGFIYLIDRGNLQIAVSGFIGGAIVAFLNGKMKTFGILIALAAAIKLWPILFLIVLIKRNEIKAFVISISTFLVFTVVPLFFIDLGGSRPIRYLNSQIDYIINFNEVYGPLWHAGAKNSSISALLRFFELYFENNTLVDFLISNFLILQIIIFSIILYFYFRARIKNIFLELLLISCTLLLIPGAQYGYSFSLVAMLVPLLISYDKILLMNLKLQEIKLYSPKLTNDYLLYIIAVISVPWTFRIQDTSGDTSYPMDLNTLLTPTGLALIIVICIFNLNKKNSFQEQ